jgi:hypothetical protein
MRPAEGHLWPEADFGKDICGAFSPLSRLARQWLNSSGNRWLYPQSINLEIVIDGRVYRFSPPSNAWRAWIAAEIGPGGEVHEHGRVVA